MLDQLNGSPGTGRLGRLSQAAPGRFNERSYALVKRGLDLCAVLLTAPLWVPMVAVLALLTRLDGGPAFYAQQRIGLHGRTFRLWKLRSMVPDAETCLERHLAADPAARLEWDTTQKLRADPRVTPVGRILRKYSLDELPQLWNVLVGDMSLVGPRPMFPAQQALYPGTAYYRLRPGLTGLWQISERNSVSFAERAIYDNRYAECISLTTDLKVLVGTVAVVVRGTGC